MRSRPMIVIAVLGALLVAPVPAPAIELSTLRSKLTREIGHAGPATGVWVRDLDSSRTLFSARADVARVPASVEKLYTTAGALLALGPAATLKTTVVGHGFLDPDGVWRGDVVLRGGGDPTLDRDAIALLAKRMQAAGVLRVDGSVLGDESLFDTLRGSYDSGGAYDADIGGVLGALTVSRGFARDGRPAAEAARRLARALRATGVRVEERSGSGRAPADGRLLASVKSPPLRDLIALINVPSDNFMAEVLVKALGARSGAGGTTRAGIAVIGARIAQLGVHPEIVDGSGLSRVDRTTPRQVVRLLAKMHAGPYAVPFERSLAVAGRSGTLRRRMRGTAAQDRCSAKTGTLIGVSTLAGICRVAGGRAIGFAMLFNDTSVDRAHRIQDHIATDIARYTPAAAAPTR